MSKKKHILGECQVKDHWVTERLARCLDFTDSEIRNLTSIMVEAPNGICWVVYRVPDKEYHEREEACRTRATQLKEHVS